MRELKFRVWDNLKKEWLKKKVYHSSISLNEKEIGEFVFKQHPEGYTIQQYTGLKDKNGRDIYEGDIIEALHLNYKNHYTSKTGIITWHHSYWAIEDYKLFVMEDDSLNVIGNIFETPELLK